MLVVSRGVRVVPAPRLSILLLGASAWALLFLNILNVNFLLQILARWIGEGETIWLVLVEKNSFFWSTGSGGGGVDGLGVGGEVLKQPCAVSLGPPHNVHRSCTRHVSVRYSPDGG